jgi:cation diffusion facilitator family transporter
MPSSKTAVYAGLAGNLAIAITKFVAAGIGGSSAMLAEAIHSTIDTADESLLLVGERAAKKPPDDLHPFGHGQDLYVYNLLVGVLIFGLGGGVTFVEGIAQIRSGEQVESLTLNFVVLGLAFLFEFASWVVALRAVQSDKGDQKFFKFVRYAKDPTKLTVFLESSAALIGIGIAALGIGLAQLLNIPELDGVASIMIGLLMCGVATVLIQESKGLLVGEAVVPDVAEELKKILLDDPDVVGCHRMVTMHLGPEDVLLAADLEFRDDASVATAAAAVKRLEHAVTKAHPEVKQLFLESKTSQHDDRDAPDALKKHSSR